MKHVKAPNKWSSEEGKTVFLAGTIDMGNSEDWQSRVAEELSDTDAVILNPRRDAWDNSWEQNIDNPEFNEQVNWELDGIECADFVLFHFVGGSKSPVTLMEIGYALGMLQNEVIVCCTNGYYRKGNVDILCARHGIKVHTKLEDALDELREDLV